MLNQPPEPFREQRPWGEFMKFTENSPSTVKLITVSAGEAFSLQQHAHRDESWHIISGTGTITIGTKKENIIEGRDYFVPRETLHRIEAGNKAVVFLEISYGAFDENDITRVEDKYGRTKNTRA